MLNIQSKISHLSPLPIWQIFSKICSIPHPSKHEEKLATEIIHWVNSLNIMACRDHVGNIIIKKPATSGMEHLKTVALQAHLDMVPQKNEHTIHDFTTDPIEAYIDGEWITANGTTLGADNGIGLSACLAVLVSNDIEHGPLEVLLTIDEEVGMTGAANLESGMLNADILLNTDSEQEGEIYIGSAGSVDCEITLPIDAEPCTTEYKTYLVTLKGLNGGHSGVDIHIGRGNANKLLARFLERYAERLDLKISHFMGGSLRNAIPREAFLTISIPKSKESLLESSISNYLDELKKEFGTTEPNIIISAEYEAKNAQLVWSYDTQTKFIHLLNSIPNGVMRMSNEATNTVETSLNVGVVTTTENNVSILSLIRSLDDIKKTQLGDILSSLVSLYDGHIKFNSDYPGWQPNPDSEIVNVFQSVYEQLYGRKPNIMVIHAGLECGLFKKNYPQMDMLSFGPTIKYPHSPDEKVNINTVEQFWQQLIQMLKCIPEK